MQKIQKIFRANYIGEEITSEMTYTGGQWEYKREYVPNQIDIHKHTTQAVVIGNGDSRKTFPVNLLGLHRGGPLGRDTVQTYGCNALYRDFAPTFLVSTGRGITQEISQTEYTADHIVYTNSQQLLEYPGKFYLIPQDPTWNAGTIATYLACFDGHQRVFLMGFDNLSGENLNNNMYAGTNAYQSMDHNYDDVYWIKSMQYIMSMYNEVQFIRVMPNKFWQVPNEWAALPNFQQIDFQKFVLMIGL
jgi:hypothetical protein